MQQHSRYAVFIVKCLSTPGKGFWSEDKLKQTFKECSEPIYTSLKNFFCAQVKTLADFIRVKVKKK